MELDQIKKPQNPIKFRSFLRCIRSIEQSHISKADSPHGQRKNPKLAKQSLSFNILYIKSVEDKREGVEIVGGIDG